MKTNLHSCNPFKSSSSAIFVWPWFKNVRTKQKQQTNGAIWLVYRTDTNTRGFWLVKRTFGEKTARELSRNQPTLRFNVILPNDWPIEQCLFHIRVFFGGKTKRPCFDLFIHWLIKQITNTYRNYFTRVCFYVPHKLVTVTTIWILRDFVTELPKELK